MGEMTDDMIDRMMFPDYDDMERRVYNEYKHEINTGLGDRSVRLPPNTKHTCCGQLMVEAPPNLAGEYRATTGLLPFYITHYCECGNVDVEYHSGTKVRWHLNKLVPYSGSGYDDETKAAKEAVFTKEKKKMAQNNALYEIKVDTNTTLYGTKMAVNSAGLWVMDIKGQEQPLAVDKSVVTEVMPYTVGVKFSNSTKVYHFFAKEGDVAVGDVLLLDNYQDHVIVTNVNTKSKTADRWLVGLKLAGTRLESGEE